MANKITYDDKVAIVPKGTHINQFWDEDANEVKDMHNLEVDRLDATNASLEVVEDATATNTAAIDINSTNIANNVYATNLLDGRVDNLEDNQVTGVVQYSTKAELDAVTGTLNVSYKVTNDGTASNNGYYHWTGSLPYVKDADLNNGTIESGNVEAVKGGDIHSYVKNRDEASYVSFGNTGSGCKMPVRNTLFNPSGWMLELTLWIGQAGLGEVLFITQDIGGINGHIDDDKFVLSKGGVGDILSFDVAPDKGIRADYAVTYDGANYQAYRNGEPHAITLINNYTTDPIYINDWYVGSYNFTSNVYDGRIGMIRITNTHQSAVGVKSFYNNGNPEGRRFVKSDFVVLEMLAENSTLNAWYDTSNNKIKGELREIEQFNSTADFHKYSNTEYLKGVPTNIYVCVGTEFNLWYDALIPNYRESGYIIECECPSGNNSERSFRYTPSTAGVNVTLNIKIMDADAAIVDSTTVVIAAIARDEGTGTKQVLFIGDSTTDSEPDLYLSGRTKYEMMHEISDMAIADGGVAPLFLGTNGISPYKHEGRSGYSSDMFITNNPTYPNPFWDNGIGSNNFKKYMLDNANFGGVDAIDMVFIQLGINDLKNNAVLPHIVLGRLQILVDTILNPTYGYPDAKIIIAGSPYLADDRTGWALHFNANSSAEEYVHSMVNLATLIKERFDFNIDNPNCYYVPNYLWIDRRYGYPSGQVAVSGRDAETERQYLDSVHPDLSGYLQAADSYYSIYRTLAPVI